jgi:hypothetical protein
LLLRRSSSLPIVHRHHHPTRTVTVTQSQRSRIVTVTPAEGSSHATGDHPYRSSSAVVSRHRPPAIIDNAAESSAWRSRKSSSPAQSRNRIVRVPHHYFSRHRLIVVQGNTG